MAHLWQGIIDEYRQWLPFGEETAAVTLREGGTPLVRARALEERTGAQVYIKVEGANPTGSFKDRGMTSAITQVATTDTRMVACASTGNTSASAAAYAAQAGLECAVILPAGKIAAGKLAQAIVHGARLVAVDGNFDDCLRIVRALTEKYPVALVNSVNPYRLQGQKTAAFEIVDELGDAPDIHVLPVGNAGNISAYWMGYNEYAGRRTATSMGELPASATPRATKVPRMWGVQAAGAAPFVAGHPIENPETIATAIRIGNPASWDYAVAARDDSGGWIRAVSDTEILEAQALLAAQVGIFVEPASAASVAGLLAAAQAGEVPAGATIVCTVTGNGLKDTATALAGRELDLTPIEPSVEAAVKVLSL
ncbi:threonine synthase [Actinobaculum suis]|uniref:Threonine synthase n=1 Tax=Actinobaculum suis TaxID=1657 RepID=A0A0K9ET47_9ACTO|nr:threonine synthase [Actinobaculum suis]KMY23006.1 threonine synthase [Actinobaculum suis]MDY5152982.1 threonine synthase [Actinobaculum suis]OCA94626.1 threonine synthase [Actinobaculum suis]OCA94938.1 threonine synthase [Actinobaculum suis]SDE37641.1 threonine synthase [Actinobaculum suis]